MKIFVQAAEIHLICKRISHIVLPAEGGRMAKSKEKKDIVEKEFVAFPDVAAGESYCSDRKGHIRFSGFMI